jgi:hypothetical protein
MGGEIMNLARDLIEYLTAHHRKRIKAMSEEELTVEMEKLYHKIPREEMPEKVRKSVEAKLTLYYARKKAGVLDRLDIWPRPPDPSYPDPSHDYGMSIKEALEIDERWDPW